MWPIIGGNLDGNIEGREYALRTFSGQVFGREALLSGGPAYDEAGVSTGDADNFVLPISSLVLRLGVGEYVRADEHKWPRRDRMGAQFALG